MEWEAAVVILGSVFPGRGGAAPSVFRFSSSPASRCLSAGRPLLPASRCSAPGRGGRGSRGRPRAGQRLGPGPPALPAAVGRSASCGPRGERARGPRRRPPPDPPRQRPLRRPPGPRPRAGGGASRPSGRGGAMPMKGRFPVRRTLQYLSQGDVIFKSAVKVMTVNYNTAGELSEGAR